MGKNKKVKLGDIALEGAKFYFNIGIVSYAWDQEQGGWRVDLRIYESVIPESFQQFFFTKDLPSRASALWKLKLAVKDAETALNDSKA